MNGLPTCLLRYPVCPGDPASRSGLDSNMQGHHPAGEVVIVHMTKTAFLHQGLEAFLVGMHADRFGQVAVAVGIAGHQLAHVRQDVEAVPVVGFFQRLGHLGKLQHQQLSTGLEHPAHLGQGHILVGHVAQAEGHADQVEMVVREREFFGVAHQRGQRKAMVEQAVAAGAEHGLVDVGVHHAAAGPHLSGKGHGQIARAASDVEHLIALFEVGHLHGIRFPDAVQPHRHQVVHDVVFGCDRVEHATHVFGLVFFIDRLEAEVGGAHGQAFSGGGRRRCRPFQAWDRRGRRLLPAGAVRSRPTVRFAARPESTGTPR